MQGLILKWMKRCGEIRSVVWGLARRTVVTCSRCTSKCALPRGRLALEPLAWIVEIALLHTVRKRGLGCQELLAVMLFKLDSLQILLNILFLLHVLVSLEDLFVSLVSHVNLSLELLIALLSKSVKLLLLLLNKKGFSSHDLLHPHLLILFVFFLLEFDNLELNLVSLSVFLLSHKLVLNLLEVKQLRWGFENLRDFLFESCSVLL